MTDTTFRDAHQSLLATRMRTYDLLAIAEAYARLVPEMFSIEMWGGATFDTAMRFLKESPWQRLGELRTRIPNILFQMLLRASNAVGYTNYPDNVVRAFVRESAAAGIDLFRVFDSLNWVPNMRVAIEAVLETGALCEAAICYTGDILDPSRPKYDLEYYVELAKQLAAMGAHILAIKDMAGLCKPYAAEQLVRALKQEIGIPIHFHTHDTSGIAGASVLKGSEVGLDMADGAIAPFSGLTSQPNLNALNEALRSTPRTTGVDDAALRELSYYWLAVREFYTPFESDMKAPDADLYLHEMPGGQFTNLQEQARALGLIARWPEICRMYAAANQVLGDIVKVTPTSKSVGDLALFLVTNNLSADAILDPDRELAFPESVVDLLAGRMGQPPGGFPPTVRQRVLRNVKPVTGRPGESLPPADFAAAADKVKKLAGRDPTDQEVVTYLLYPRVFQDFLAHQQTYSDTSVLPTPFFLYGQQPGEELSVEHRAGQNADRQTAHGRRAASRRPPHRLLRVERAAAGGDDRQQIAGNGSRPPPEGRPRQCQADCCADAGPRGERRGENRRHGETRSKAAHARSHENGNHPLRRTRRPSGRRPRQSRHAGRGGRAGREHGVRRGSRRRAALASAVCQCRGWRGD